MRDFAQPDPMLRFIPEETAPQAFWNLPPQDRSARGRLYIISLCAGLEPIAAWQVALDYTPDGLALLDDVVGFNDDARIMQMLDSTAVERAGNPAGMLSSPPGGFA